MYGFRDPDIDEQMNGQSLAASSSDSIFFDELHRPLSIDDLKIADSEFHQELTSSEDLDDVRRRLVSLVNRREAHYHSLHCSIDGLERVNALCCIKVLTNLLSERNEILGGCSALDTLHAIAFKLVKVPEENRSFFLDVLHILRGSKSLSGIYGRCIRRESCGSDEREVRSAQLDAHAFRLMRRVAQYPSGLDNDLIVQRRLNRDRILEALGGRREDWDDYSWQLGNVLLRLSDVEGVLTLAPEEAEAIALANSKGVPFGITPYYASLMDYEPWSRRDRMLRAQVIPKINYVERIVAARESDPRLLDFMEEHKTAPEHLVTRRYPMIAIMKPYNSCAQICSYCQRNWEIKEVLSPNALASPEQIDAAVRWFEDNPAITEVLLTGGGPNGDGRFGAGRGAVATSFNQAHSQDQDRNEIASRVAHAVYRGMHRDAPLLPCTAQKGTMHSHALRTLNRGDAGGDARGTAASASGHGRVQPASLHVRELPPLRNRGA